jgi:hypothetical protein
MKATTYALFFAAAIGLANAAQADVIAYADSPIATTQGYGNSLGADFTVNSPVVVNHLGVFDNGVTANLAGADGSSGVSVAIFNLTTSAQVGPLETFSVASPGTQINADAFKAVAPFVLPAGNYSVVAFNDVNGNSAIGAGIIQSLNTDNGSITFISGGRNAGGFVLPPGHNDSHSYAAGTFIVTPEPSSCVLAALGLVGLLCVGFRRMKGRALALLLAAAPLLLATSPAAATTIVSGWEVIDNSSAPDALGSFTTTGFVNLANPADTPRDWNSTAAYDSNGVSGATATYTFHLTPGRYEIATSVSDASNRATNAPYSIDGGPSILVNQQVAATGPPTLFDGTTNIPFEVLSSSYQFAGGNLKVVLTDTANGYVLADAIAVTAVTPEPSSFVLAGLAAVGLFAIARRRKG